MKSRSKLLWIVVICAIALATVVLVSSLWFHNGFAAVIHNESPYSMTSIEVNGSPGSWVQAVPDIPAGKSLTIQVTQEFSESSLGIRFQSDGVEIDQVHDVYIMNGGLGMTAIFTVEKDLKVNIDWHDGPSWYWR